MRRPPVGTCAVLVPAVVVQWSVVVAPTCGKAPQAPRSPQHLWHCHRREGLCDAMPGLAQGAFTKLWHLRDAEAAPQQATARVLRANLPLRVYTPDRQICVFQRRQGAQNDEGSKYCKK